jgi:hypothetical protein
MMIAVPFGVFKSALTCWSVCSSCYVDTVALSIAFSPIIDRTQSRMIPIAIVMTFPSAHQSSIRRASMNQGLIIRIPTTTETELPPSPLSLLPHKIEEAVLSGDHGWCLVLRAFGMAREDIIPRHCIDGDLAIF